MKLYKLETIQFINASIEECWEFFSNPKNLKKITPSYMGFVIIERVEEKMYPGQIIQYFVKPILGIPMRWVTEITQVKENQFFVDEQRFGPYKLWHHKHFFKEVGDGVEMKDIVHYALPMGFVGRMAHKLFVRRQLNTIFSHRYKIVNELFNE